MNHPEGEGTPRSRVMLYAQCYPDADAAMSLATQLARQIGADLHGYLVRDRAFLADAGGTVPAVVSFAGVRTTGVKVEDMLSAFRADARRFRDKLQRLAREETLPAAFHEIEGRLTEAMQTTARSGDVLIAGFKPVLQRRADLVVVLEQGRTPPDYAQILAEKLQKRLVVLVPGEGQDDLSARLDRMSPAAVILAGAHAGFPSLPRVFEAARCPVIILQPSA